MASSTTYYISCRDYKLLIFSIKRPKSPRPLNKSELDVDKFAFIFAPTFVKNELN